MASENLPGHQKSPYSDIDLIHVFETDFHIF